jgi:hypothetical protein
MEGRKAHKEESKDGRTEGSKEGRHIRHGRKEGRHTRDEGNTDGWKEGIKERKEGIRKKEGI